MTDRSRGAEFDEGKSECRQRAESEVLPIRNPRKAVERAVGPKAQLFESRRARPERVKVGTVNRANANSGFDRLDKLTPSGRVGDRLNELLKHARAVDVDLSIEL